MPKLIYNHKSTIAKILTILFFLVLQLLAFLLFFWYSIQEIFLVLLMLPVGIAIAVFQYKKYSVPYQLFEDRIEIYPSLFSQRKEILPLDLFFQARFEDEFNAQHSFFGYLNSDVIYLYTNKSITSSWIRKNRLELPVSDWKNRNEAIINMLQLFQDRGMQLFVKTRRKPVLEDLGVKNWN